MAAPVGPNPYPLSIVNEIIRSVTFNITYVISNEILYRLGFYNRQGEIYGEAIGKGFEQFSADATASVISHWAPTFFKIGLITSGLPLVYKYIYKQAEHRIGKPKMVTDMRETHFYSPLLTAINSLNPWAKKEENRIQPIFNENIRKQIDDVIDTTQNIIRNEGCFENLLLFGPPGTGKTMIAEFIATQSNMDYYMFSAAELTQYIQRKEHIKELNALFDRAERSGRGVVIFLDEVDAIAGPRDKMDQEHIELLNTLLKRTGKSSDRFMLIGATNRPLDAAFKSRMSIRINIEPPAFEQRLQILTTYANHFFTRGEVTEYFSAEVLRGIAQKTEGFSGRAIFQLMNSLFNKKNTLQDGRLNQEIIDQKVNQFIQQERE